MTFMILGFRILKIRSAPKFRNLYYNLSLVLGLISQCVTNSHEQLEDLVPDELLGSGNLALYKAKKDDATI